MCLQSCKLHICTGIRPFTKRFQGIMCVGQSICKSYHNMSMCSLIRWKYRSLIDLSQSHEKFQKYRFDWLIWKVATHDPSIEFVKYTPTHTQTINISHLKNSTLSNLEKISTLLKRRKNPQKKHWRNFREKSRLYNVNPLPGIRSIH